MNAHENAARTASDIDPLAASTVAPKSVLFANGTVGGTSILALNQSLTNLYFTTWQRNDDHHGADGGR